MNKPLAVLLACFAAAEVSAAQPSRTILVLPFENKSGRADVGWLSESFAATLSARLAGPDRLTFDKAERDAAYRQTGIPPGTPITRASALTVARFLDADWVVTGVFSIEGDVLKADSTLIDVGRLRLAGPFEVNGQLTELADIETRLAWRILALQDPSFTVGSEEDFRRQFPALRLDAHENYIRGVLASDSEARVRFLTEANRRDPSDHRAAFELARFYYENKDYETSARWLRAMAAGDADRVEVRFIKGVNEFFLGREAAAEKTFTELSRDVPIAEVWNNLGFLQSHLGRWVEATASFDRAYQADPSDPDFSFNLGVCMWNVKKYTVAIRYLREAMQSAPEDPEIHRLLRESLAATGDAEGKKKEDQWLEARDENLTNGTAAAILPNPRLKKQFNRRAYRQLMQAGHAAKEARVLAAPAAGEAKP